MLRLWSGLGYYSRARNLHRAAQMIASAHGGRFPRRVEDVAALPGVGRSTAAAICVFAFGERHAILDGNVKRVLARCAASRATAEKEVADRLWREAERLLPRRRIEAYTQGLMDLGATVCTRGKPRCRRARCTDVVSRSARLDRQVPAPRPRKRLPHKRTLMLVLTRAGEVLLEKRPPSGIWGGMWCLPEAARKTDIEAYCLKRFGAHVIEIGACRDRARLHALQTGYPAVAPAGVGAGARGGGAGGDVAVARRGARRGDPRAGQAHPRSAVEILNHKARPELVEGDTKDTKEKQEQELNRQARQENQNKEGNKITKTD